MKEFLAIGFLFFVGCATTTYITPDSVTKYDSKFSDTDLRFMAGKMTQSILKSGLFDSGVKVIGLLHIKNGTSEHINTDSIADEIMIMLIKTGKVKFANRQNLKDLIDEQKLSAMGLVDEAKAKEIGKIYGIDYFLSGTIESIEKKSNVSELTYYRLSLKLTNSETSEIVWADKVELKKKATKHFMDW